MASTRVCAGQWLVGFVRCGGHRGPTAGAEPLTRTVHTVRRRWFPVVGTTMNVVPCVQDTGTCTGFAQNQPRANRARASVGHSPTVSPSETR